MDGADGNDAVYASILARVERSELRGKCLDVVRKEHRSVGRHVRKASASLTALRQLQEAAKHLRPSGDWLVGRLETQLKSVEELQSRLETTVEQLEKDARQRKRKRPVEKKKSAIQKEAEQVDKSREEGKTETYRTDGDSEEDVVFLEVVAPTEKRKESGSVKEETQERTEDGEDVAVEVAGGHEQEDELRIASVEERIREDEDTSGCLEEEELQVAVDEERLGAVRDSDALPNGLVRVCDSIVRVKEEVVTPVGQIQIEASSGVSALDKNLESAGEESPLELEVFESSEESAVEVDLSDAEEVAMELEVPDSESDDDFSPCVEMTTKLSKARAAVRLAEFPVVVEQLRSYLLQCKHLTTADLDGEYLFAHKRITSEEAEDMGRAFKTVINVGISLPRRPRTKLALHDLLDTIETLELTLGALPEVLRPYVKLKPKSNCCVSC
jgi:hypothetical protein